MYCKASISFESNQPRNIERGPRHPLKEAACWVHVRSKFYDIHLATDSPIASEALTRIGELYGIASEVRGQSLQIRQQIREGITCGTRNSWHFEMIKIRRKL
jgi:Transposase IS66 family